MARNFAVMSTTIWKTDDFTNLTVAAQQAYFLLTTQSDITAAGVLSLNVKRWSNRAKDSTPESVVAALQELQAHRYVVYDVETEELLVRSFVRWDGGYGNPKRRPVIERAAKEVESPLIRRALAAEFKRLGLPDEWLAHSLSAAHRDADPMGDTEASENPAWLADPDEEFSQANRVSDGVSPSDGVVVIPGLHVGTTTHNPQPVPPSAGAASPRRAKPASDEITANVGVVVGAFVDGATKAGLDAPSGALRGRVGKRARALLAEGKNLAKLIDAATSLGASEHSDLDIEYRKVDAAQKGYAGPTRTQGQAGTSTSTTRANQARAAAAELQADLAAGRMPSFSRPQIGGAA